MTIDITRESAEALRAMVVMFDQLSRDKWTALERGNFEEVQDIGRRQLDIAYGFVGIVDGVLRAHDV